MDISNSSLTRLEVNSMYTRVEGWEGGGERWRERERERDEGKRSANEPTISSL